MKMIANSVFAAVVLFLCYVFAFWSLPFMGDEPAESSVSMVLWSLAIILVVDALAYWRFKTLNRLWLAAAGNKLVLWSFQTVFMLVIVGANLLIGAVGWFYTLQALA